MVRKDFFCSSLMGTVRYGTGKLFSVRIPTFDELKVWIKEVSCLCNALLLLADTTDTLVIRRAGKRNLEGFLTIFEETGQGVRLSATIGAYPVGVVLPHAIVFLTHGYSLWRYIRHPRMSGLLLAHS